MHKDPFAGRKRNAMGDIGGMEEVVVEFDPPKGLKLEGEEGSAMVNWVMTPEGRVRITAIDGVTIGETENGEVEMEEGEYA